MIYAQSLASVRCLPAACHTVPRFYHRSRRYMAAERHRQAYRLRMRMLATTLQRLHARRHVLHAGAHQQRHAACAACRSSLQTTSRTRPRCATRAAARGARSCTRWSPAALPASCTSTPLWCCRASSIYATDAELFKYNPAAISAVCPAAPEGCRWPQGFRESGFL